MMTHEGVSEDMLKLHRWKRSKKPAHYPLAVILLDIMSISIFLSMYLQPGKQPWQQITRIPNAADNRAVVTGSDGRLYLIGGYHRISQFRKSYTFPATQMEIYDPQTHRWTTTDGPPMGQCRDTDRDCTRTTYAAADGAGHLTVAVVYPVAYTGTLYSYTLSQHAWSTKSYLPPSAIHFRGSAVIVMAPSGFIYSLTPCHEIPVNDRCGVAQEYSPATQTWTSIAPPPAEIGMPQSAIWGADGQLYAIGGCCEKTQTGHFLSLGTVAAYTPAHDRWTTLAALPVFHQYRALVTTKDNHIYALGGTCDFQMESCRNSMHSDTSVNNYDIKTNTWSTGPDLPLKWWFFEAATDQTGRIYALGESNNTVLAYDPNSK